MNNLTYQEAYNKIIDAYFKDEIHPFSPQFCFCGTLCGGRGWYSGVSFPNITIHRYHSGYTGLELGLMEHSLLKKVWAVNDYDDEWEDALFAGMSAALDVLKQIHIERGEVIDGPVVPFTKRELVK